MKIMAIDYGAVRTGVAISDPTGSLTGYTTVIAHKNSAKVLEELEKIISDCAVDELVMGLPKNMDGSACASDPQYREIAAQLENRTGIHVELWDERRTTIEAHQILHADGKKMKNHKSLVDAVAASLILEGYLKKKSQQAMKSEKGKSDH